jgi:hypothetical protein
MTRRSRKARSGGPLPPLATLTKVHRGEARRVPELVDTERAVAESALLGAKLFGPDVTIAAASRRIEIFSVAPR